ncbi:bifunctional proline dehydrogenase/L-glutamate gamma-semialdehyde dehydrogenase PutA [Chitiniphilus purpureus]|uniref:Bifunctional protein PutA n=1 Tax=Chitiniphilus purpureus TaxID=2981137 RepID=A0ABY6DIN2_9NEIS|nr:bifunctional proline dehydrogenase/L-glutamate gamma-semialdehyde dehydrogenase PutA [Chitiniphilus sp. CD1]UXY14205.1 bifunctional proline dehydrogenase/L-glutamate gamma-semialdehyde dehydrogenase PutA [Chitiniphilus sp. CD1]
MALVDSLSGAAPLVPGFTAPRHVSEARILRALLPLAHLSADERAFAEGQGQLLLESLREARRHGGGADALFAAFPLGTPAGRALLTLAEALLRIPDTATADQLIRDQLHAADWAHGERSPSLLVNLARVGLATAGSWSTSQPGETLVRFALKQALRRTAEHFVGGEGIAAALAKRQPGFLYSFDMLGEAALTQQDAERYAQAYANAITHLGRQGGATGATSPCGVSVKLSALHPRYEHRQWTQVQRALYPRLLALARMAREADLPFTIDAEESERTPLTLALFGRLLAEPTLSGWDGLGIAVQAYQKSALAQIDWLVETAATRRRRIVVRLVKGAYWDSEIKRAQLEAWPDYTVYTRKAHTDTSFLACARQLLAAADSVYPAFATHNVFSALALHAMAADRPLEFQCLYGMGEALYRQLAGHGIDRPCRVYTPVGAHAALLPYLVRRLLENGANQSFVHQLLVSENLADAQIDPVTASTAAIPGLPAPTHRPGHGAVAPGLDWSDDDAVAALHGDMAADRPPTVAAPLLGADPCMPAVAHALFNPARPYEAIGEMAASSARDVAAACHTAAGEAAAWAATPVARRAQMLDNAAALLIARRGALLSLLVREAGKTLPAALAEVREAVDFCHYYARQARQLWPGAAPTPLGPVAAISPWNFPLAIFVGQIAAALAAGNPVLAKPAAETPLIARLATELLHEAGIPRGALQYLPGGGEVGARLSADPHIRGVLFTGSLPAAQAIHAALAAGDPVRPLIAETGGVNAMVVDGSALAEQVVRDALVSAFDSAGQRCSALRLLCLPEETADGIIALLGDAMDELQVGDPAELASDLGPLISHGAKANVEQALQALADQGMRITRAPLAPRDGHFLAPALVEIDAPERLPGEIFGPVLAVLRYRRTELPLLLARLDALGYGLTLGIASRCPSLIKTVTQMVRVGNVYVNRNQIGAVVGHQPFGGERLSGTGPKAGGPWLLWRLVRDADPCALIPAAAPAVPHPALPALLQLAQAQPDGAALQQRIVGLFQRDLLSVEVTLPAVAGERNTLGYRARGTVLCLAATASERILQMACALATGNRVRIPAGTNLPAWPGSLAGQVSVVADPLHTAFDAVLWDGQHDPALPQRLAALPGPIRQPILPLSDGAYPLFRLLTEVTVTLNTAAVGGDAELLGGTP